MHVGPKPTNKGFVMKVFSSICLKLYLETFSSSDFASCLLASGYVSIQYLNLLGSKGIKTLEGGG